MEANPRTVSQIHDAAINYLRRGWCVVSVPCRQKRPVLKRWQHLRLGVSELSHYFRDAELNIGVLLGEPSKWLIDVDLDHLRALEIAPRHLPVTQAVFGRPGKPRSHWLYRGTRPVATRQWRMPDRTMVVELRSTGGQTIFPGSVHPSGESIEWEVDGEPAEVDPVELQIRIQRIYDTVCGDQGVRVKNAAPASSVSHRAAPARVVERARRYLAKTPPAISGQNGHGQTFHAACVLVVGFGLGREQALDLLKEWNLVCQPPWTDKELEHKVDDALKQPGWRGGLLAQSRPCVAAPSSTAIERANRHAIEHRRRVRRRATA